MSVFVLQGEKRLEADARKSSGAQAEPVAPGLAMGELELGRKVLERKGPRVERGKPFRAGSRAGAVRLRHEAPLGHAAADAMNSAARSAACCLCAYEVQPLPVGVRYSCKSPRSLPEEKSPQAGIELPLP